MATGRSSPFLASCERTSSTTRDQSFPSDIELVTLVPAIDNTASEQSLESSSLDLSGARRSTVAAAYPTKIQTTSLRGDAFPVQSNKSSLVRRLILDSWLCESIAMCFSVGCLMAIAFTVRTYDGQRIPELMSGLTLNAIISVLSTASRASLIFVVSATLGQLKWCWLRTSGRQIHDIQAIDDASRGPLGALGVLLSWTGGSLAALASAITLLMIAFGPFLQQLVEYPSRNTPQPDGIASAPQNLAYSFDEDFRSDPFYPELRAAISAGAHSDQKPFDQEPTCSTGQCSWASFQSVGWCSECENHTLSTTLHNCNLGTIIQNKTDYSQYCVLELKNGLNFSLLNEAPRKLQMDTTSSYMPDGFTFNVTKDIIRPVRFGGLGLLLSSYVSMDSRLDPLLVKNDTHFLDVPNPLMVFGHADLRYAQDIEIKEDLDFDLLRVIEAEVCILTLCEKTLSLDRVDGKTTWKEETKNYGSLFKLTTAQNLDGLCWQARESDVVYEQFLRDGFTRTSPFYVDKSHGAFCPVEIYADASREYLVGQYEERLHVVKEINASYLLSSETGAQRKTSDTVGPESTRNLSRRLEGIAIALTNYGLLTTNNTVDGVANAEESYVRIRWQWIALPAFLELASLMLLILTMIHSRREDVPLWKSSALALIYHGVDELRGKETLEVERLSGIEVTAKTTDVQLVKSEYGVNKLSKRSGYLVVDQDG